MPNIEITGSGDDVEGNDDVGATPPIPLTAVQIAERERLAQVRAVQKCTTETKLAQLEVDAKARAALAEAGFAMPASKSPLDAAIASCAKPAGMFRWSDGNFYRAQHGRSRLPLPVQR